MSIDFAVIGGTGLTAIEGLKIIHREVVHTPYGTPSGQITHGVMGEKRIAFLARHGYTDNIPPHRVNYRANIWALKHVGVEKIVAIAAVGGITARMSPQSLVIPNQLIDYTFGRSHTFFEDGLDSVTHIDFSYPYCPDLRQALLEAGQQAQLTLINGATYGATQGPRFETVAEIRRLERDGCDVVGMTAMPEAALAREMGLSYASCNVVANWAAGKAAPVITLTDIQHNLQAAMQQVRLLLKSLAC